MPPPPLPSSLIEIPDFWANLNAISFVEGFYTSPLYMYIRIQKRPFVRARYAALMTKLFDALYYYTHVQYYYCGLSLNLYPPRSARVRVGRTAGRWRGGSAQISRSFDADGEARSEAQGSFLDASLSR